MSEYKITSECGKYGVKSISLGHGSTGGELWAWINTEHATRVGYVMDIDNMEIAIDEHEEEMRCLIMEWE